MGLPSSSVSKVSASAGDPGSISESGRSPREGNGKPLQYSCLENPMDRGAWQVTVHGVMRVGRDLATTERERAVMYSMMTVANTAVWYT